MIAIMNVLMAFWAVSTVNCFVPRNIRLNIFQRQASLNVGLTVGDAVIAEVDDILGSVSDPKVSFLIRNGGVTTKASMSTKLLSSTERLALQTGSVMQVYVSKMDDDLVQVQLKPADGSKPVILREAPTADAKTFRPVRVLTSPKPKGAKAEAVSPKIPNGGLLLSNLKTGMELEGIVQSCTAYAAFVSANVYRAGKAGSFQAINGMLHKVDIVDKSQMTLSRTRQTSRSNRGYDSGDSAPEGIISIGTRMKVYVKEVYKQSGRLTLTTDPTIDKLRVRKQKEEIRSAGNDRRRARRLRRQLEKVAVGDTVSGVVQQVIPAGILVSVNSLGPLNVTGLIAKRDLPKQFEVPPDLKESFQKQLLEQDFAVGRQITCGVLQVNPNIGEKVAYNLKMLFEELGALAADNVQVRDSGDKDATDDNDDDEEEGAEEMFDDSDLKEIFDELRGNKPLLSVQDLRDWADVQDMIANNVIDLNDIEGAVQEVTGKPKGKALTLTFEQFVEIVDMLQDAMEGMTTDLDEFEESDDEEEEEEAKPAALPVIVKPAVKITAAAPTPVAQKMKLVLEKVPDVEEEGEDDETMKEVAQELFDELRGDDAKLSTTAFKSWSDIDDLIKDELLTMKDINDLLTKVAGTSKTLDFNQFFTLVSTLDKMAEEEISIEDEDDENMPSIEVRRAVAMDGFNLLKGSNEKVSVAALKESAGVEEMLKDGVVTPEQLDDIVSSVAGKQKQIGFEDFFLIATTLDKTAEAGNLYLRTDGDDDEEEELNGDDGEEEELSEDDIKEVAQELFDELRCKDKKVSIAAFMGMRDVIDMIEDGLVTEDQIKEILSDAADGKKQLDFEQFFDVVSQLDDLAENADAEDEETMEEVAKELFDELRGKNAKVSIAAFKAWDDVKELIDNELLSEAALDETITRVLAGKKQLDFEQFFELVNELDELSEDAEEYTDEDAEEEESIDDNEEMEELTEDDVRSLFDELRGKESKLSVSKFLSCDEVKEMIEDGVVSKEEIKVMVSEANKGKKELDFDQFYNVVIQLDEMSDAAIEENDDQEEESAEEADEENEEDDDEEEEMTEEEMKDMAKELFDELRGKDKKVSIAAFMAWNDVKEMIKEEIVSKEEIKDLVKEVAGSKKELNFEQFYEIVTKLDELDEDYNEDEENDDEEDEEEEESNNDDDDEEDDEEMTEEEMKDMAKELFDELRGMDKKVSIAAFMAWDDVKEMIKEEIVTKEEIKDLVKEVAGSKKELDFEQFYEIVTKLDDLDEDYIEEENDEEEEEEEESNNDDEEEEVNEEDMKDMAKELFDELRGKDKKVSIAAFMAWDDVKEMIKEEIVSKEEIKELMKEVAGSKKELDFEQFYEVVTKLDDLAEGEDDYEEEDDEEMSEEEVREIFDDLRGKNAKLSVAAIMSWDTIVDIVKDKIVSKSQMEDMISESADGKRVLDFEQFSDFIDQLDNLEDPEDLEDEDTEVLASSRGFGKASSSKVIDIKAEVSPKVSPKAEEIQEKEEDLVFEDMSDEDVDDMLHEVFGELKGKGKALSMKSFKKWEDIKEMLSADLIDVATIDSLAQKVGVKKDGDLSYEQFKALVELLDEVAGDDEESMEMDGRISDDEERVEIDEDDIGGDGNDDEEEMTPEEIEEMTRDLFDTIRGNKPTLSVATFLSWDEIQNEELLDDETINILLEEVGANKNRKGDLTYQQFSDLINLLDETVTALGDGQLQGENIMDDEDNEDEGKMEEESASNVSATLEEREAIDAEISEERNERNVLDGIDDEGVDEIAKQIYEDLKGDADSLSVKAFLAWEDVSELVEQGIVQLSTVNLLIKEVGGAKTQTLTFDQFWQLVNLLEDASDAAADKVAAGMDDRDEDDEDIEDLTPEEEEAMAKNIFDGLKNPKTGTVTAKKLQKWEGIKEALDSGELSKGAFNSAIKKIGAEKTNEVDFEQFKTLMDILEGFINGEEDDDMVTEVVASKGFARAAEPVAVVAAVVAKKVVKAVVPDVKAEKESEAASITREIYEELVGDDKILTVEALREWEDMQEMIESGSLKRSSLEKALVKVGALATGELTLKQFMALIDIIQGAVDDSNLKFEYEDEVSAKDKGFETSKKSSVLNSDDDEEEEENWGDDESGGDFEEVTEEEAARQAFEELLAEGSDTISLVDFLQWEDVQELLEVGALSKDDLATAIENAGVSVELDGITFEKFYDLLQVIDEFVDREKLPADQSDVVFESKIIVDKDSNVEEVMGMVDGLIGEDEDKLKITYLSGKNGAAPAEGEAAIEAMQDDLDEEDEEDDDEEVMEMFEELSKGKDYITEKALRKWDELQELVEAELATQEAIDSYLSRIEIKNGRVSLKAFKHFMRMLDMVIVDESGNFLTMDDADKAVDLDALDDEDDEGETDDEA